MAQAQLDPTIMSMGNIGPNIPSMSDMASKQLGGLGSQLLLQPQPAPTQQMAQAQAPSQPQGQSAPLRNGGYEYQGPDMSPKNIQNQANWVPLHGQDFVNSLSPQEKRVMPIVQQYVDGRAPIPTGRALMSPALQQIYQLANQYDPSFDGANYPSRVQAMKDMAAGGKDRTTFTAGETAINHLTKLMGQIPTVSGVSAPLIGTTINRGVNAYQNASGTGQVNTYNDTLGHVAEETTKLYRNAAGADADVARNMAGMSPELSTGQKVNGVANTIGLIYSKLQPVVNAYNDSTGKTKAPSDFMANETKQSLAKLVLQTGAKIDDPGINALASQMKAAQSQPQQANPAAGANNLQGKTFQQMIDHARALGLAK